MGPRKEFDDDPEEEEAAEEAAEEEADEGSAEEESAEEESAAEEETEEAAEEEEETAEEEEEEEEEEEDEEEEDMVDPRELIKEKCGRSKDCKPFKSELNKCNSRLENGDLLFEGETCTEELFNFLHCVDHCAAPQIIRALK